MKFGKNLSAEAVPEWRDCYLDYEHIKIFVKLIKYIVFLIKRAQSMLECISSHPVDNRVSRMSGDVLQTEQVKYSDELKGCINELMELADEANQNFYAAHESEMYISKQFFHMKIMELSLKFKKVTKISSFYLSDKSQESLMTLVEFLYIELIMLKNMKEDNLEGQRKILKKHKKYSEGCLPVPERRNRKFKRLSKQLNTLTEDMENFYISLSKMPSKASREHLRNLTQKKQVTHSKSFLFGSWVGICLAVVAFLVITLSYLSVSVETDSVFNRDFPTWRGIAYLIFYVWILGFNTYFFQQYHISHRIIFHYNEHHYSSATDIFLVAGFFSTLFLAMFTLYTLAIAGILNLGGFVQQYLVLFVWGSFVLFLINPFPIFNYKSRLYSFRLIIKSAISPFIGVPFEVIWMTDQLISLATPFKDLGYTICYYIHVDFTADPKISDNYCTSITRIQVVFIVGAIAYSYRIMQCIRQGYDKGKYIGTHQFFNTLKYLSSLITLILSYLYKVSGDSLFPAWIIFAAISTIYSYAWDLKIDWALLDWSAPKKLLRKQLAYDPYQFYYFVMILNLVFRLVWVATLSPSIVDNLLGSPQLFSLVTGAIEIFRRGIWNLLRVEREHLANCNNFKAIPDTPNDIESELMKQIMSPYASNFINQNILDQIKDNTEKSAETSKSFIQLIRESLDRDRLDKLDRQATAKQIKNKVNRCAPIIEAVAKQYEGETQRK